MEGAKEPVVTHAPGSSGATSTRDLRVSNLIESWNGESRVSVNEFFNKIERAALTGNWSDADKVTVVITKVTGAAALFLNSGEEAARPDRAAV